MINPFGRQRRRPGASAEARGGYSNRRVYLAGLVFTVITVCAATVAIWELRRDRIANDMEDTDNLTVVLAAQTARTFQAIDLVLREVAGLAATAGVSDPEQFRQRMASEEVHRLLVDRRHSLPQADAITLIDDTGRIINFSRTWPVPLIDTSDRDFYAYWREHNEPGPFIGAPVINKVTGKWVITLTRRIADPQGKFLGIALIVVEASYFEQFYQEIHTVDGESVSLFRSDGTLLVRQPRREPLIGTRIPAQAK